MTESGSDNFIDEIIVCSYDILNSITNFIFDYSINIVIALKTEALIRREISLGLASYNFLAPFVLLVLNTTVWWLRHNAHYLLLLECVDNCVKKRKL